MEANKPVFENICNAMADMIQGDVSNLDLETGTCIITVEAKIQTGLDSWWDSIFTDYPELENSVGIEARGNGTIVWRYKNGKCTYCAWDSNVLVDVANGKLPHTEEDDGGDVDANGNVLHEIDPYGKDRWYEYDSNGKMIHAKCSDGTETWYNSFGYAYHAFDYKGVEYWNDYDENGNIVHRKSTNGTEAWYNSFGYAYHEIDFKGVEHWKDYDENGKLIHSKDSTGKEKWYNQ